MLRIAHKQGEVIKSVSVKSNAYEEFKELFFRKHNEKIDKQKKRLANAKRPTSCQSNN